MRIEPTPDAEFSEDLVAPRFRVLLWGQPQNERFAWSLDEYDVFDTHDVLEVIQWAKAQGTSHFEVAVASEVELSTMNERDRRLVRFIKVAGDRGVQETTALGVTFYN
jgi:hypothetical protein